MGKNKSSAFFYEDLHQNDGRGIPPGKSLPHSYSEQRSSELCPSINELIDTSQMLQKLLPPEIYMDELKANEGRQGLCFSLCSSCSSQL